MNIARQTGETDSLSIEKNEQLYGLLLNSVPALIAYIDKNLCYQFINKAYEEWFDIDAAFSIGKTIHTILGPEGYEVIKDHVDDALAGKKVHFEAEMPYMNGSRFIDANYTPHFDEYGNVKGFIAMVSDITEKKLIEKELRKKQKELQDYFDNAVVALHWVDATGNIVWANNAELKLLGYTPEEYIGHHISEFHADTNVIHDILSRLSKNETLKQYEAILRCKDGSTRHVLINSNVLWENGEFIHTRCFTLDISEKKKAEEIIERAHLELENKITERTRELLNKNKELQQSEERYHKMIDEVQDYAIILLSPNGIIENWNRGAEKIKGYKAEEIIGKSFHLFYTDEDRKRQLPEKLIEEAVINGKAKHEGWRKRKNGSNFWGSVVITALHDADDNIIGFSKVTRDLTEKKLADDRLFQYAHQLERQNKDLEQFTYIASHDLLEPLRKIRTFNTNILERETENLSERGRDYFNRSVAAANRMQKLIDDLLAFSRTTSEIKNFELTDLNKIVDEIKNIYQEVISEKNIVFEIANLPVVNVVPFQFQQLLDNLIGNAIKYCSPERTTLIIVGYEVVADLSTVNSDIDGNGDYHKISVTDNGIGFEPEFNEKIFELFQRLHGNSQYTGSGIGLAICKKIIQNHNGYIFATGEKGKGATFDIYLPV